MRSVRRALLAAAVMAGVVTPAGSIIDAPAASATSMRMGDAEVSIPIAAGLVKAEVKLHNRDGSLKLLIPKGFPAANVPKDLADVTKGAGPAPKDVQVEHSHQYQRAHWAAYRWGGTVQNASARAFWILDRTLPSEEPYVVSWFYEYNDGMRASAVHEQGLPLAWSPYAAYADDDTQDNACQKGGWSFTNFSFVTVCTTWDMGGWCDDPTAAGCAWVMHAGYHSGTNHQPSVFIKSNLRADNCMRRDVVWHEMLHTTGLGHSAEPGSVMNARLDGNCRRITYHDTQDYSWKYLHPPE